MRRTMAAVIDLVLTRGSFQKRPSYRPVRKMIDAEAIWP